MSKTWEHYHYAARHHERAAYHYNEAAKYDEAEQHEKAAHHAYLAHGHTQHAIHYDAEAAKLHAERFDRAATAASGQEAKKKSAARERLIFVFTLCCQRVKPRSPTAPRAINMGSPGMAVRDCFRQSLLARTLAGALHAEAVRLILPVIRETKMEMPDIVGNQKSLRRGWGPVGCLARGPVSASLALTGDKTPAERSQSPCGSGY
jgi:hypothetical protein